MSVFFPQQNLGILALLDEECLRPGNTSDTTFLEKLDDRCAKHPHYESRKCKKNQSDKSLPHGAFRLRHYAGNVCTVMMMMMIIILNIYPEAENAYFK